MSSFAKIAAYHVIPVDTYRVAVRMGGEGTIATSVFQKIPIARLLIFHKLKRNLENCKAFKESTLRTHSDDLIPLVTNAI